MGATRQAALEVYAHNVRFAEQRLLLELESLKRDMTQLQRQVDNAIAKGRRERLHDEWLRSPEGIADTERREERNRRRYESQLAKFHMLLDGVARNR